MTKEDYLRKKSLQLIYPIILKSNASSESLFFFRIIFGLLVGCILFFGNYLYSAIAISLFQFVMLLDYIDGTLARNKGRFSHKFLLLDRYFHYFISAFFLLAVAFSIHNFTFLIVGSIGSLFIILTALIENLYLKDKLKEVRQQKRQSKFQNLRDFLIIDSPFSIFFFLIVLNQLTLIILLFSFVKFVLLVKKIKMIKDKSSEDIKKQLAEYYHGSQAERYDNLSGSWKDMYDKEVEIIQSFLENEGEDSDLGNVNQGKILDVACGTGRHFSIYKGFEIYGVDISSEMLEKAKKRFLSAKLIKHDASELPFANNEFNICISSRFICHTPDYIKVLKEMKRVTKTKGVIIADFPNKYSLSYFPTKLRLLLGKLRYFNQFSFIGLESLAEELGLEIVDVKTRAFLPPKIFGEKLYFITKVLNKRLTDKLWKFSTPFHVKFRKL